MKSIKPGRGPSMMGGVGSIAVGIFGVIWTIGAASMGAPGFFVLFGIVFVVIAIVQAIYHFSNATGENRMSLYDITEDEPDPFEQKFGRARKVRYGDSEDDNRHHSNTTVLPKHSPSTEINFCPSCGQNVANTTYRYCPNCGQAIR